VTGGFLINGSKVFITNGPIADLLVLYAKTRPEAGSRGITAFIFETKTPGFQVARKLQKLGMHGSPTGELVFEDAFVPDDCVLGKVNEGYKVVMSGLDLERAFFAVSAIGGLEEALAVSLKYAKERVQFGQPIANFQLIQAKLADMYTDLEAARHMAHRCMWLAQQGKRVSKEAAAALLFTARASMRAADSALQIHGGWGYLTDFEVERMWRNAKLGEIGAGTNEIRQLLIARELLGMRGW
jgi:isovaleryl-CoA dehydrogenase